MKYFDVYFETDPYKKTGYSVFVRAFDENDAIAIVRDECLYNDAEDLSCHIIVTEITEKEYLDSINKS